MQKTDGLSEIFRSAGSSVNLSGTLDLSKIQVQLPELPQMNLEELLGDLDLTVSPEGFLPLAESLTEGYAEYAAAHPEADYSALAQQFGQYLGTPKAQEIGRRNISEIIQSGGGMSVTMEQLQAVVKEIAKGYGKFIVENGYQDPSKFDEDLAEYMQTEEAKAILNRYANEILQVLQVMFRLPQNSFRSFQRAHGSGHSSLCGGKRAG